MSLRTFISSKPTAVYIFRYEREDGEFREINVPSRPGRLRRTNQDEALALANRRLNEQYGYQPRKVTGVNEDGAEIETTVFDQPPRIATRRTDGSNMIDMIERPDLLQENYKFVSVKRVR